MASERLVLKWGTLKEWKTNKGGPAFEAIKRYHEVGDVSLSAMMQADTPEQKQAICDAIDALDAETVFLDWEGVDVSKDEAKAYVMEYGRKPAPTIPDEPTDG